MQLSDFMFVVQWWSVFVLLSFAVLPLTAILFTPFFDRGYIFSKTLGLMLLSYLALVLGIAKVLPFTTSHLFLLVVIIAGCNYAGLFLLGRKNLARSNLIPFIQKYGKFFLLEEILFFLALLFLAYIRSFSPDIHGLEKYMDYGFMNSIARAEFFPPKDMWLTPFSINYYYFGHFTGAVLTKFSGIPSSVTYNLILAGVFALSFVGSFSIGANLSTYILSKQKFQQIKRILAGLLTAFLVTLGGNIHTLYTLFKPYENESPVPLWQLPFAPMTFPNSYWYPNATRYIYNTIHEFPIYSWVVADLHGHVFDIPFVITVLAVLFSLLLRSQKDPVHETKSLPKLQLLKLLKPTSFYFWYLLLLSFLVSIMYMTNAWDGLIYLLLSGIFVLYIQIVSATQHTSKLAVLWGTEFLSAVVFSGLFLLVGFILFSLPFSLHFKPFVSGIGILCAPEFLVQKGTLGPFLFEQAHCQRSPWWQLLILYGFFYFFIFSFLAFLTKVKTIRISDTYVLLLIILGTLLIVIPEFIYVKDIYPAHYRANTMFKLVFQSFMLLSIASSYAVVRILTSIRARKLHLYERVSVGIFVTITLSLISLVAIYPYQAIYSYYGELKTQSGLNGTAYLDNLYPTDYQAIEWLNKHVTDQPVVLEAQGDSYTDFARVSANTGLPTVLGWTVHEWLWRNSYDVPRPPANPETVYDVPAPRIAEVQTLYESSDLKETKRLLNKYQVEYVFLGVLERQKYPNLNEEKWQQLGDIVFKNGVTSIYKIK